MSSEPSTALSEAQARVIVIKTDTDDIVKYSGNPAELPGVRFETQKALRRCGAFNLLIKHNAARLKSGQICVEDIDSIPFVTQMVIDPFGAEYTYEKPCPDTASRVSRMNDLRAASGLAPFIGYPNLNAVPDKLLKLAIPNQHEVEVEALAFALTQLSVFEDRQHANELLVECEYDGRKLAPLLDEIENQATSEDITLVTGNRNAFKEAGLRGLPLTYDAYKTFFKEFNKLEYRCPPDDRMQDRDLSQLVGTLFIKDPAHRQKWSDNLSQPIIRDHTGKVISGPPQSYKETKALAAKILRGASVIAGIDEGNQFSPAGAALLSSNLSRPNPSGPPSVQSAEEALLTDPRKSLTPSLVSDGSSVSDSSASINVPKGEDGKYLYWAPPMKLCECGTPDGGRHIRYKWPCKWYRNPNKWSADDPAGQGTGGGRGGGGRGSGEPGGRGKGKAGGKGKGKGKDTALLTQEQVKTALAAFMAASSSASAGEAAPAAAGATSSAPAASTSGKSSQSCNIANYDNDSELAAILNSDELRADLASFLADGSAAADTSIFDPVTLRMSNPNVIQCDTWVYGTHCACSRAIGAEIVLNRWTPWPSNIFLLRSNLFHSWDQVHDEIASETLGPPFGSDRTVPIWNVDGLWRDTAWGRSSHFGELPDDLCDPRVSVTMPHSQMPISLSDAADRFSTTPSIFSILDQGVRANADQHPLPCGSAIQQFAFDSVHSVCDCCPPRPKPDASSGATPTEPGPSATVSADLPIFRAPIDSGCTATCTNSLNLLTNVRVCNEEFNVADGKKSKCAAVGDMPVLLKDSKGLTFRFVFKDVRYVPDFKYTLLAVKQIWKDHRINSVFADDNKLVFPGGREVKFDSRFKLPVVNLVSETLLSKKIAAAQPSDGRDQQQCCVGFHNIKSTSHIARLPAAQAGELMHRRCHLGLNKIRALPHITGDAPKVLSSAPMSTCVHCAASQIRLAGHSGSMYAPDPKPGKLHLDLKGPFPLSIAGKYKYVAFFTDEYSRYVIVDFLHDKSEVIDATKRAIAKFNALVGTPVDEAGVAQERPRVRSMHRDHEGGLESKQFDAFRANQSLYSTTSAPHDHDLNPIAESVINVISTLATAYKSQSGAPIGFWPELIRMAVDWHNSAPQASVGSSTSDPQISPTQRFTLKQPKG